MALVLFRGSPMHVSPEPLGRPLALRAAGKSKSKIESFGQSHKKYLVMVLKLLSVD